MKATMWLMVIPFLAHSAAGASAPAPVGRGGAVASGDPVATGVGLDILRRGGNAVDAAVATSLALAVVYPEAGNLGGGGFAVVRMGGELAALDFRETAPARASRAMYLDAAGQPVPNASRIGPLAAGVPGSPAGLHELHRRFGRLPWAEVVAPAERLAAEGFVVGTYLHAQLARESLHALLSRFPETAEVWLPGGEPPAVGTRLRLPDLAATLRRYGKEGPPAITTGPVAAAIAAAAGRHGGVLTEDDLAAYKPVWRTPLVFEAFGWTLAGMPLPSSGSVILGQTFGLLERLRWPEIPRFGADRWHLLTEAYRRAYADRFLLGDPASSQATPQELLAAAWLDRRAAEIDRGKASVSTAVHPREAAGSTGVAGSAGKEGSETTHLSVVDRDGNLVALTTTLNELFGCGLYVPGAGFFLNNEMDDFATAPGKPNAFGLIQGEANAVVPGRRMLSSMSPTVAWRGREAIAVGGRGGSRIPTNTAEVLLDVLVDGDPLQTALDRPRLHHQWLPDRVEVEPDALAPETRAELARRGHPIEVRKPADSAKIHAVRLLPDGRMEAAADPRGSGLGGVVDPDPP